MNVCKKLIISVILLACIFVIANTEICAQEPTSDKYTEIYHNHENSQMKIALTFDDGPHPRYTPQILDILDKYEIKATFFVIGVNAENYPQPLEDTVRRGHEIGNHTYTHPHVSFLSRENLSDEIRKCEASVFIHGEYKPKLFRPPEGLIDSAVKSASGNLDYKVILWNIDTRDWAHTPANEIADNVLSNIKSGDIILMHDYINYNSPTPEALEIFIPQLLDEGYHFVTVSELIGISE